MTTSQERHGTDAVVPSTSEDAEREVPRRARTGAAFVTVLGLAALAGLVTALLVPLGPTTPAQGLAVMLTGLVVGLARP
jgi:hypothetical protein